MNLVADAGGTKTDWRLLHGEQITQFVSGGYNPNTHELDQFLAEITPVFAEVADSVKQVHFYGASLYPHHAAFKDGLATVFKNASMSVNNDLVGSCRSLSGDDPAFVGILGTGSAGCFYDGKEVTIHPPSLGYALGDEGSGAVLGKRLLQSIFRKGLSASVQRTFDETFKLGKEDVYAQVYKGDHPNTYLASFTRFLHEHKNDPTIHQLLISEFNNYYDAFFQGMPELTKYPFHFSGSVAFYFSDFLREIGIGRNLQMGRIVQSPIAGLALYHQKNG